MKAYILYIATLLAALALPANGQTGRIDTKWGAPSDPAMPYKLSVVAIGGNNGIVAVEDKNNNKGVITVDKDTLVYGSSSDMTTTTVKLTVTPNTGYIIRKDYPKAYRTGKTEELEDFFIDDDNPYTFLMPPYPITIKVAYAHQLNSIDAVTLKAEATADNVLSKLPAYIPITLEGGRKDSLAVSGWAFKESGSSDTGTNAYVATAGAYNRFTATLATLPDSIADATTPLLTYGANDTTCTIIVANKVEVLTPTSPDKDIIISGGNGDNLNSQEDSNGDKTAFNGTIGDGTGTTTVKSLEVKDGVKDATLTFNGVTVSDGTTAGTTTIRGGADLTLRLEGTNSLGTLSVENGASVVLDKTGNAKLESTIISNAGIFHDSTATITSVTGAGALDINGSLSGGGEVNTNTTVILTASTKDVIDTDVTGTTTFIWQKKNADGSYTLMKQNTYKEDGTPVGTKSTSKDNGIVDTYQFVASTVGTTAYRCLIERSVTSGEESSATTATTLLSTQPAEVIVKKETPTPPPYIPTYFTVILPAVEGFTTDPAAGSYNIEEWDSFTFSLTPAEGYTGSTLVVTTSRGETLEPRKSDGKYFIDDITGDISITITVTPPPTPPTANEGIEPDAVRIWTSTGLLHISLPHPATVEVFTLAGSRCKQIQVPAGDTQIDLPAGIYIIVADDHTSKAIVK